MSTLFPSTTELFAPGPYQAVLTLALSWVLYKCWAFPNRPTIEAPTQDVQVTQELRKKNHRERLTTALFYVTFVTSFCIHSPWLMIIFITAMNCKAMGEYVQIVTPCILSTSFSDASKKSDQSRNNDKHNENNHTKQRSTNSAHTSTLQHNKTTDATSPPSSHPVVEERYYRYDSKDRLLQICAALQTLASATGRFEVHSFSTFVMLCIVFSYHMWAVMIGNTPLNKDTFNRLSLHFFGFLWVPWTTSHVMMMFHWGYYYAGGFVAVSLLTSWLGDGAAFYIGKVVGRFHIFPHVSPNKTLEGTIATGVFSIGLCMLFKYIQLATTSLSQTIPYTSQINDTVFMNLPAMSMQQYIWLGFMIACFDVAGDVCESFVKRMGNVKDSGTFFTGHGGVLDRFDSFYFVAPAIAYYMYYFVLEHPLVV